MVGGGGGGGGIPHLQEPIHFIIGEQHRELPTGQQAAQCVQHPAIGKVPLLYTVAY